METVTTENVTPAKAASWLNRNKGNRKLRVGVAEKYADDMRAGLWTQCPVPISFYDDGEIADGQHRLWAIVESETTQRFLILKGLPRDAGLNLDTGLSRTIVDNAKIAGIDAGLSNRLVACARSIAAGGPADRATQSYAAKLALVAEHREAAEFAVSSVRPVRLLCNAVVSGAVGRAWYHEQDKDKLKRFCDVLATGMSEGMHESAAIALRNYLLAKGSLAATSSLWVDTFVKVQNCIQYFVKGRQLTVVKSVKEEPYPAPGKKRPGFKPQGRPSEQRRRSAVESRATAKASS